MEKIIEKGPGESPAAAASLGRLLREARERQGFSVADMANQTKLAARQIEALEADDLAHLPEMPFVRGFVRSYAKILQLDSKPLLAFLPELNLDSTPLLLTSVEVPFSGIHTTQRQNLILLGAALFLAVLVVIFAVWNFTTPPDRAELPKTAPAPVETPVTLPAEMQIDPVPPASGVIETVPLVPSPPVQQPAPPVPLPVPPVPQPVQAPVSLAAPPADSSATSLHLKFDEASWVEIRDKNNKRLSSQAHSRGSELLLSGQPPYAAIIGHAASVRLYHRGKQVDLSPFINASSDVARLTLE